MGSDTGGAPDDDDGARVGSVAAPALVISGGGSFQPEPLDTAGV